MDMTMEQMASMVCVLLMIVGGLVLLTNLIVQVIKNVGPLKDFVTNILVIIVAVVLAMITFPAVLTHLYGFELMWYVWVASVVLGFIVAFVAMKGWSAFHELWKRSKYNKSTGE